MTTKLPAQAQPTFRAIYLPDLSGGGAGRRHVDLAPLFVEAGYRVTFLACGTPVVSTDCPHGPAEILDRARYGSLVPIGDAEALGCAMIEALNREPDRMALTRRGQMFSAVRCAREYARLIADCTPQAGSWGQIHKQAQV